MRTSRNLLGHAEIERLLRRLTEVVLEKADAARGREIARVGYLDNYYPADALGINHGWCALWAVLARRLVGGTIMVTIPHVFLYLRGWSYDAECPEGATSHMDLPTYQGVPYAAPERATIECAYDRWDGEVPYERPPFHWLKEIT